MDSEPENMGCKKDLLFLKPQDNYYLSNDEPLKCLEETQPLNLIIGANNSGKSRFIRELIKLDFHILENESWDELDKLIGELEELYPDCIDGLLSIKDRLISTKNMEILKEIVQLPCVDDFNDIEVRKNIVQRISEFERKTFNGAVYIPALRTAHTLYESDTKVILADVFKSTLNKNYSLMPGFPFQFSHVDIEIFTGMELYDYLKDARSGETTVRSRLKDFENFLSENFFGDKEVEVVAIVDKSAPESRRINVHIEDLEDRDIHELAGC